MKRSIRTVLITLLAVQFAGCTSWQATGQPLKELKGKHVRLTMDDGRQLRGRLSVTDSLGILVLQPQSLDSARIQIDTALVATVEQQKFSEGTIALASAIVVVTVLVVTIAAWASAWDDWELFPEEGSSRGH